EQIRFAPHDLLVAHAHREAARAYQAETHVDEEVTEAILGKDEALAGVTVIVVFHPVADRIIRIRAKAVANIERGTLHPGNLLLAEQEPVFHQIIVHQPGKDFVAPLHPVEMLTPIGMEGITVAIPQLQFGIADARRCPRYRAPCQHANEDKHYTENDR